MNEITMTIPVQVRVPDQSISRMSMLWPEKGVVRQGSSNAARILSPDPMLIFDGVNPEKSGLAERVPWICVPLTLDGYVVLVIVSVGRLEIS